MPKEKLLTIAGLKEKAEKVLEEREEKAPNQGTMASMPAATSVAAKRKAAAKRQPRRTAARETSPSPERPGSRAAPSVSGGGASRRGSTTASLDLVASERLRKADPDLHQVVERLGYMPVCFEKLTVEKMFRPNMGRSLYQDWIGVWCHLVT